MLKAPLAGGPMGLAQFQKQSGNWWHRAPGSVQVKRPWPALALDLDLDLEQVLGHEARQHALVGHSRPVVRRFAEEPDPGAEAPWVR